MRLAFYTYSYTDRLEMPVVPVLERIAKAGYPGIDVSGTHGASDDPKSFDAAQRRTTRETTERLKLRVEAVITHASLTDSLIADRQPLDLKGTVDLASELGATVVTFHMGGVPNGIEPEAIWKKVVDHIRAASDYAAARHVKIAVDGIWPEWIVRNPDDLQRLFDDVDHSEFGVNFDPCYLVLIGVDPATYVRRFPSRIVHAHLKDHKGRHPKWEHLIPGRGEMDYAAVLRALSEAKFQGSCAVECFTDMPFAEACDDGYRNMNAAAREAKVVFAR